MTYYILANHFDGELIQASSEFLEQAPGQLLIVREGQIPDLDRYAWHPGSLAFIEKDLSRFPTKLQFISKLKQEELVAIYQLSKTDTNVEVWLDKFRLAEDMWLDSPDLQATLPLFELIGVLAPGRATEILS